ncbi:MAG TPA: histidine--tRNA ligase [Candidatus Saccharimonadales bacterium]|nr:histidine--tRNA ligase [Candidatus Saccharimonadales bacterium]
MPLSTQPYKGARDFYPEDKRIQKYMFDVMRRTVEKFGYEEYDAPILEPLELYLAKTGEEIVNEQTYAFEDRGGRKVAIRPEMTPTVSRMVAAKRQELAYPLRWYSIPNLWRYERPQRGRLREHWQLNVDLFGLSGIEAEFEIILLVDNILKAFGAKRSMYAIKLNSRRFTDYVLQEYVGLDTVQTYSMSKLIDRMHKMDELEFMAQLDAICTPFQREAGAVDKLQQILRARTIAELPAEVRAHESLGRINYLLDALAQTGIVNAEFDATLMRGFDYYTDVVFEVFDKHPDNNRSLFGGGRYDGLVGLFGVEPVPTIGFGMGDVTLQNFLEIHELLPKLHTGTNLYVVLVGDVFLAAQKPIAELRATGLNLAVDTTGRKIGAQIQTAEKKGIHYVLFIGEQEIAEERYGLKNLQTGAEEKHGISRLITVVKDYRQAAVDIDDNL